MSRLRSALKTKFAERKDDIQIYTPRNVETVKLKFRGERMAKVRIPCFLCASLAHTFTLSNHKRHSALSLKLPPSPPPPFPVCSCQKTSPIPSSPHPICAISPVSARA